MRTIPTAVFGHLTRVFTLCVVVLGAAVLALGVLPARAHAGQLDGDVVAAHVTEFSSGPVRGQDPSTGPSVDSPSESNAGSNVPKGPRIDPEESEQATQDKAQRKAIIAGVAAVLLVIVILGRKQRNKNKPGGKS